MVFKRVAHKDAAGAWVSVGKKSAEKATVGGRKFPVRARRGGYASEEIVRVGNETVGPSERTLLVPLVVDGEIDRRWTGPEGTLLAREHRAAAVGELPQSAFSLGRGEPVIPTRYE
jgi:nicotinate phosphoribosyltransferase